MNTASDFIRNEFKITLSMLLTDAARSMINEIDGGTPRDMARDHFDRRAQIYIQEQTSKYAERMAAAGDPISCEALTEMQQKITKSIATQTDAFIEKINRHEE